MQETGVFYTFTNRTTQEYMQINILHKLTRWYFTRGALPYWCILAMDASFIFISGMVSFYIRFGGMVLAQRFWQASLALLLCMAIYCICFAAFHTYRGVLRYSSFVDLQRIAMAMIVASVFVCGLHQIEVYTELREYMRFPSFRAVCFISGFSTMLMWGLRILVKICYDISQQTNHAQKVFIYGAMSGGVALAKSIISRPDEDYILAGFVSTDSKIARAWLMGAKVYSDTDDLPLIMQKKNATTLLVSPIQTSTFRSRSSLIDALIKANIKILMMSEAEEWDGKSELQHTRLKEVDIEDLLPRDKIEVDMNAIGHMLEGKRIMITGAAGSIGSEIARQVSRFAPSKLILVDQAETPMHDVRLWMSRHVNKQEQDTEVLTIVGSICNQGHMEQIFTEHRPEYIFHAAAYKHVPMMEDNPAMAIQNNVYGTRIIADLAVKYGTKKFVMISTDKAVNPTNVMGCSKRICEIYCQALNQAIHTDKTVKGVTQFITTRFGNVLGSNGSVIPIFREQIKKGGPVTVTHKDIIRYFMLIPEACRLVLEAGTMGKGGEIFVFDMGKPVRIADLAQRMIDLSGAKNVTIAFTGLRNGEKLYEEVLNDSEQTKPTHHPKIKIAAVREYPYDLALKNEQELYDLSISFDDMAIVKKMKEIVPEYRSQHSKYQVLD